MVAKSDDVGEIGHGICLFDIAVYEKAKKGKP